MTEIAPYKERNDPENDDALKALEELPANARHTIVQHVKGRHVIVQHVHSGGEGYVNSSSESRKQELENNKLRTELNSANELNKILRDEIEILKAEISKISNETISLKKLIKEPACVP